MIVTDLRSKFYAPLLEGQRVLVLVCYDVDAICALRVLQSLFQSDNIQYTVIPISSKEDLVKAYRSHRNSLQNIVLLNFGATFDVIDLLDPPPNVNIFVADSHRPVDVHNIYRDSQISVLMKEDEDMNSVPRYEDVFNDNEGSDDEEDEEEVNYSLEQLEARKRRREWHINRDNVLFAYKEASYWGDSIALFCFELAWRLSKDSSELLWLAIVGVSDQYVNGKVEPTRYLSCCSMLQSHVTRLSHRREERAGVLNDITSEGEDNGSGQTRNCQVSIRRVKELRLTLYRQWSLFESMRHTLPVACKFRVWLLKGHKRLLEFFAEVGLPLIQCKQKYTSMDLELRTNVQNWMEDLTEKYGLDQLFGDSFIASKGFKYRYCSDDVALATRALIESPDKEKSPNQKFLEAIDCLSWSNVELLDTGLEMAKIQLIAILRQVHNIIDMKTVAFGGPFLYTVIQETAPDAKLFSYSGSLLALGRFLLQAYVASSRHKGVATLPLVVITPDVNQPGIGLAAGITAVTELSARNFFPQAFTLAGNMIKCPVEPDLHDAAVVRFPYSEKTPFIEALIRVFTS